MRASFASLLRQVLGTIGADKAALITIAGGVLFYAALYPQPYLNDVPRQQAIVAVDWDQSATSRRLLRWIDATPGVGIEGLLPSVEMAHQMMASGSVHGFVLVPHGFERDLQRGFSPSVSVAGDANYFLVYGAIVESVVDASTALRETVQVGRLLQIGQPYDAALAQWRPIKLNERSLFNTGMGYMGYVIPAVFILILHQTLLLAAGLIGTTSTELGDDVSWRLLLARFTVMFLIYFCLALLYMGALFNFYGVSRHADPLELLIVIAVFVAATSALGTLLGVLLPRRELVAPVVMVTSLPLVFTAGFVWPAESIPAPILTLSHLFPAGTAIQSFLKLNQMSAGLDLVAGHCWILVAQACIYLTLAHSINHRRQVGIVRMQERLQQDQ